MEKKNPTNKQLSSVSCPTCGAGVGAPCVWNSGGLRLGTHLNRKLSALEVIDRDEPVNTTAKSADDEGRSSAARSLPLR